MELPGPAPSTARVRWNHALRPWRRASGTARVLVVLGLLITMFFAFLALFAGRIAPYEEDQYRKEVGVEADGTPIYETLPKRAEPSRDYPFGTTVGSLDVFSRVIHGARLAFGVVILSTLLSLSIGVPLGLMSGYVGGRFDRILVLLMDAVYAFPALLLSIIVAFILKEKLDPGLPSAAVAVGVVYIPQYYRVIRNHTLSVKQEPFVEAARSLGAPRRTIIGRYVFFNVVQSVPVIFTLNAADAVLTLAGLGFLGYGVTYPNAEWGLDVSRGVSDAVSNIYWTALFPGLAIMLLVTGLTLLGEGLNDMINPLLRSRGLSTRASRRRGEPAPEPIAGAVADLEPVDEPT